MSFWKHETPCRPQAMSSWRPCPKPPAAGKGKISTSVTDGAKAPPELSKHGLFIDFGSLRLFGILGLFQVSPLPTSKMFHIEGKVVNPQFV